ncbi:MAG: DUF937 domain-containing protein, partial [Bryobacteraceae bacterium]
MSNSLLSSLSNLLDRDLISSLALHIGESEESVSRGLGSAFAAILSGMADRTRDPGLLSQIFRMVRSVPADSLTNVNIDHLSRETGTSPLFDMGQRLLRMLFGDNQRSVAEAIARTSGLHSSGAARLISMAAPLALAFLGKLVRDEYMSLAGFTSLLQSEGPGIKAYQPSGRSNLYETSTLSVNASPAVAGSVEETPEHSSRWVLPAVAALALLAIFWFVRRGSDDARSAANHAANIAKTEMSGDKSRARASIMRVGEFIDLQLPGNIRLKVPEGGVETRLL